jgi:Zn-dependent protease/predicted transcriptional regulator
MSGHSWRLGRVAGVKIRIDSSWVLIAVLITYSLYAEFALTYRSLSGVAAGFLAGAGAVLFFGSVLAHELVHAVTARRRGMRVEGITLFLFGGATHADVEANGPKDEFVVSILGPLSSVMLGAVFALIAGALDHVRTDPVAGTLGYLAWVNFALAVFNLLPGLPLDGGRVLRSIVWGVTGNMRRATRVASVLGEVLGYTMVAGGLLLLFADALTSGIWFAAIGWFWAQAAKASYTDVEVHGLLRSFVAEDVMDSEIVSVSADLSVYQAVDEFLHHPGHDAVAVHENGRPAGYVTLSALRRVARDEWFARTVRDTMTALEPRFAVVRHTPIDQVLSILESGERECVVVVEGDAIVGLITNADVAHWIQRRKLLAA